MKHTQRCDRCGKFVQECSLLADGDSAICIDCWGERCSELEAAECIWRETDEYWSTSCGELFTINDGTPSDNGMFFCYHCGKRLVVQLEDMAVYSPPALDTPEHYPGYPGIKNEW